MGVVPPIVPIPILFVRILAPRRGASFLSSVSTRETTSRIWRLAGWSPDLARRPTPRWGIDFLSVGSLTKRTEERINDFSYSVSLVSLSGRSQGGAACPLIQTGSRRLSATLAIFCYSIGVFHLSLSGGLSIGRSAFANEARPRWSVFSRALRSSTR